jgi:hypothetical protein
VQAMIEAKSKKLEKQQEAIEVLQKQNNELQVRLERVEAAVSK